MNRFSVLFAMIGVLIPALILGGVYADSVNAFLRARVPQLHFEGDTLLVWGTLILIAFVFGLLVMYLLIYP